MITVKYRKGMLTLSNVWFSQDIMSSITGKVSGADLIIVHGVDAQNVDGIFIRNKQYTLITDLKVEETSLMAGVKKNVRYEIHRCEKEGARIEFHESSQIMSNLECVRGLRDVYEQMYFEKGLKVKFNYRLFLEYIRNNVAVITIGLVDNTPLVFHSYITDGSKVRLLHSASNFRSSSHDKAQIGRLNKYLHYKDMVSFRSQGISDYDWGGISSLDDPNGIDQFKISFGGKMHSYDNYIIGNTVFGKVTVICMKSVNRITRFVKHVHTTN